MHDLVGSLSLIGRNFWFLETLEFYYFCSKIPMLFLYIIDRDFFQHSVLIILTSPDQVQP